jgi:hypothetical protein
LKTVAEAISPHGMHKVLEAIVHLEEVAKCIGEMMPQWKCAECGKDIPFKDSVCVTVKPDGKPMLSKTREHRWVRHDARYCSQACRQKAYRKRKRVTAISSGTNAKLSRGDGSTVAEAA